MADVRIPPQTAIAAQLGRTSVAPRPEAVRAAQRAFFEAALGQSNAAIPVKKVGVPTATTTAARASFDAPPGAEPSRFARPGSLVDIKV